MLSKPILIQGNDLFIVHNKYHDRWWPGDRRTEAYDVTNQRYRNSHAKIEDRKMQILWCAGLKILCEISKVPFEISHKILNLHTAK